MAEGKRDALTQQALRDLDAIGPWARIFLSLMILFLIIKYTPILDLIYYFFYIFLVPFVALASLCVLNVELYNKFHRLVQSVSQDIRNKVSETIEELQEQDHATVKDVATAMKQQWDKTEQ
jgi:ABC-type multidrug transport system fused ATPase/permease subunit